MTTDDIIKGAIRDNTGAFFETYAKIWPKDRTKGLITPKQNHLQRKIQMAIDALREKEIPVRLIVLKPRQRGSTTYITALWYTLMRRTSSSIVFIGGQSDQTVGGYEMVKTYHANDRFDWGNTGVVNEKGATFSNGSRMKKETAKDVQAGIGDTYTACHCTEVARWAQYGVANAADVMSNILKAVPLIPASYIFLESTAEGVGNDYHKRWLDAIDAEDFISGKEEVTHGKYIRVFAPWFEFVESALRLTEQQKQKMEQTLDDEEEYRGERELIERYGVSDANGTMRLGSSVTTFDVWEQLAWRRYAIREECKRDLSTFNRDFPHSWQTAFTTSGNMRFNAAGVSAMRKLAAKRSPEYGTIEQGKEKIVWRRTDKMEAKYVVWEKPSPGERYILSIDPMTGASQVGGSDPDYHGAFVLRAGKWVAGGKWIKPAVVARVIQSRFDIDVLEEASWRLAKMYGGQSGCMIVVEINKDRGLIELFKKRGANLYMREIFNRREFKTTSAIGYDTNIKTREILIDTLARAIREWDKQGEGIDIWDSITLAEMENFVTKENGRSEASDGQHDDCIFGVALGLQTIEHATTYWPQRGFNSLPPDMRGQGMGSNTQPNAFS